MLNDIVWHEEPWRAGGGGGTRERLRLGPTSEAPQLGNETRQ